MTIEAPKAAPADTPIKPGSASGFLKRPCNEAPEIPRLAPTNPANITLGNLICSSTLFSSVEAFPEMKFINDELKLPMRKPINSDKRTKKNKPIMMRFCFFVIFNGFA